MYKPKHKAVVIRNDGSVKEFSNDDTFAVRRFVAANRGIMLMRAFFVLNDKGEYVSAE